MANLDNVSEIKNLDKDDHLRNIQEFPEQCVQCWDDWKKMPLPANFIQSKSVLLCGMGGSGIGGSLVSNLARKASIPVMVWKDYQIPGFVNKDTLVIITSYSGETEETLTSYQQAAEKTNKIIVISSGGTAASWSTKYRNPYYKIEYGSEPRAAIGYTFISLLAIFHKLRLIEFTQEDFDEAILLVRGLQKKIDLNISTGSNNAKMLAQKLAGKIPVILGSGYMAEVAQRFKGEFNENAKTASYYETIPEMNHNSLVGLKFPKDLKHKIFFIILQSKFDNQRNRLRQTIIGQILDQERIDYEYIFLEPSPTPIAEIFQMIHFGDYISYYLACLNHVEPNPVRIIKFLKDKLAEKPLEK